jgi:AcrR family transcriptional regulator
VNTDLQSERHSAILAAAEKVFDKYGYASTTMEAIALEAGIAKGSVYNYFRSKEELFHQVVAQVVAISETDAKAALSAGKSASQKLGLAIDFWFERLNYYGRIGRLMFEAGAAASVDTEQGKRLAKQFKGVYELKLGITRSILAEGMKSGEFHSKVDIDTSAALLVAILDGIGIEVILNVGVRPTDELKNVLISGILSSLTLEPSDAGAKPKKGRV